MSSEGWNCSKCNNLNQENCNYCARCDRKRGVNAEGSGTNEQKGNNKTAQTKNKSVARKAAKPNNNSTQSLSDSRHGCTLTYRALIAGSTRKTLCDIARHVFLRTTGPAENVILIYV
jgi:hypothetical protein